ncbi:MAG TPA: hypothetical protein VHK24_10375 [Steroidobacter sp.]|jgi:hypothetical protein|nr:hypothetical protein [Steroidobacter sp.]
MRAGPVLRIFLPLAALAGCGKAHDEEAQIRTVIRRMEQAVEARNVRDLMEHASAQYRDAYGQGPEEAARYARGFFFTNQSIHLLTRIEELDRPSAGEAQVKVLVGMLGREAESGEDWNLAADLYEFDAAMVREGDEWKVIYAKWRRK